MRLSICTLCEAATLHDGLLNILGAGISSIGRPSFPAPIAVQLVGAASFGPGETIEGFTIDIALVRAGREVGSLSLDAATDGISNPKLLPGGSMAPIQISLPFLVPAPDNYTVRVTFQVTGHPDVTPDIVELPITAFLVDQPALTYDR